MKKTNEEYLVSKIVENYEIDVYTLKENPVSGFLGETYIVNDIFVLKIPKRGGAINNPQGNVKFSTHVMNEANLHGIPAPLNLKTKKGLLYAFDENIGYFHLMEKINFKSSKESLLSKRDLSFALGFHASKITLLTSNVNKFYSFEEKEFYNHWSVESTLNKILNIFNIGYNSSLEEGIRQMEIAAENISKFDYIPKTLIKQLLNKEPLEIIEFLKMMNNEDYLISRNVVIHNDIKPQNLSLHLDKSKTIKVTGSFDYTMSSLGNPIVNIASTIIDSFIGISEEFKIDYKDILELSKGVLYGFEMSKNEILSLEYHIRAACLRKYVLRWEYFRNEINGFPKDYIVDFVNPKDMYDVLLSFNSKFSQESLNYLVLELSKEINPNVVGLDKVVKFLNSNLYQKLRNEKYWEIKCIINNIYNESLEKNIFVKI